MARRRPIVSYLRAPAAPGDPSLDAQRRAVQAFAQANGYRVVEEFVHDRGGGAPGRRVRLDAAINRARDVRCPVVVAGLECLSRDAGGLGHLVTHDTPFVVAADPPFTLHAYRMWTAEQRARHGRKIKRALTAKKAEGVKLGNPVNLYEAGVAGRETQIARAEVFAAKVLPIVDKIRASGVTSFNGIAEELNRRGVRTARGGRWAAMSVKRVVERKGEPSRT